MAARTVTLANVLADIRFRADVEGQTNRHPDASLIREVNRSHQRLRQILSGSGNDLFLTRTAPATMTAGAVSADVAFGEVDWPAGAEEIHGVDIVYSGRVVPLRPVSFGARNDFQWETLTSPGRTGVPLGFHVYSVGAESTTTVTAGKIQIVPAPDQAYSYVIWYLPAWVDVTNVTHVFHDVHGCMDWVEWDVVAKVSGRDNDAQNTYAVAVQERDRVLREVINATSRQQRAGAISREDTRGRDEMHRAFTESL
jgi:hypothetical protein